MIKSEVDELVERTERRVKQQKMTLQDYLEALGKTDEQYREELKPTAEVRLRRGLGVADCVLFEDDRYAFNQRLDYWYDVQEFERLGPMDVFRAHDYGDVSGRKESGNRKHEKRLHGHVESGASGV